MGPFFMMNGASENPHLDKIVTFAVRINEVVRRPPSSPPPSLSGHRSTKQLTQ